MPAFDVVDLDPADHPAVGETAPDFTRPLVTDEFWEDRSIADVAADAAADGTPVVLAFLPMAGSFVAEYVTKALRDRGVCETAAVFGVTISTPYEIADFERRVGVPFPIFSDPGNHVARRYGIEHDLDGMAGIEESRPAIFVLDGDLAVEYAWAAAEWPSFPDYDALEAAL